MPRGGARNGTPGKAYANRTDMGGQNVVAAQPGNQPGAKLAVQAATGQQYGAATAQKASQAAVPMAGSPQPIQGSAPTQPGQPFPTAQNPLNSPTTHGLPITTGIDSGAGAGSEALLPTLPDQMNMKALSLLNQLGDNISPQVLMVRNYLQAQAENGFNR